MSKNFILFLNFLMLLDLGNSQDDILWNYERFTKRIDNYVRVGNVSEVCEKQLKELRANNTQALWDLFDSSSKFPWSGLSTSSLSDWGNYDQCIGINQVYSDGEIEGKYCLAGLLLPSNISSAEDDVKNLDFSSWYKLSICMPSGCTAADYIQIFKIPTINDVQCHTKSDTTNYTTGEIAMLAVLIMIAALIIMSTTYDVYLFKKQKKHTNQLYIAFSIFTNGRKLLKTTKGKNKEQIRIFDGIKTISMAWVISGHAMIAWNNYSLINNKIVANYLSDIRVVYITTAHLAVDSFFYMSGFLMGYLYMKQKNRPIKVQIMSIPLMILHRIIRLTPALAMMYFVLITVYRHTGSGPLWVPGYDGLVKPCHKYWWTFFLYIQNYYNYNDVCAVPTWYLSADMQLFLISPFILIPLAALLAKSSKNFKIVMWILLGLNLFGIFMPLAFKLIYTEYDNLYDTHSMLIDYTMGLMMGIFLRETKDKPFFFGKIKSASTVNIILWVVTFITMAVAALFQQEITNNDYPHTTLALTHSLMRPAWCLGLSWMVYSSYHNYGGIVNWILTRPTMQITSKLSYCMYLTHGLVVAHFVLLTRTRIWFHDYVVFMNWCGFFIMTMVVSFVWTLAFESPFIIIEKIIFGGATTKQTTKKIQSNIVDAVESGSGHHIEKEKI